MAAVYLLGENIEFETQLLNHEDCGWFFLRRLGKNTLGIFLKKFKNKLRNIQFNKFIYYII